MNAGMWVWPLEAAPPPHQSGWHRGFTAPDHLNRNLNPSPNLTIMLDHQDQTAINTVVSSGTPFFCCLRFTAASHSKFVTSLDRYIATFILSL